MQQVAADPQRREWEGLVERVASSAGFQKSHRSRELLRFLCERALSDPGAAAHEQEIGVSVFGRPDGYDTGQDTLVRVQVSQLRKKLQQYFESEGRAESLVIEIPKGTYTPAFIRRAVESPAVEIAGPRMWRPVNRLTLVFALLAAGSIALAASLALRSTHIGNPNSAASSSPTLDALWQQMFANGRAACVVLSDSNLAVFEDLIRHHLSLAEYQNKEFLRLATGRLKDPNQRGVATDLMTRYFTHIADAHLAGEFQLLNAAHEVPTNVVFARDFGVAYLQSHNVILLGSRRTDPWVDLFESQLNFRTVDEDNPVNTYFRNCSPRPGESATYGVDWGHRSYCRVAFLPNLTRNGNVLLISGTDMASTEAGGQFISSERWVQALHSALRLSGRAPFPYFELLLKVDFVVPNLPAFEIAALRFPKT